MATRRIDHSRDGERVELHPVTKEWVQGDRYGEIVRLTHYVADRLDPRESAWTIVTVKLDRSGRTRRFHADNVRVIEAIR